MRNLFLLIFLWTGQFAFSQVAISIDGSNPDPSAMLEVKSTEKGILVPRMSSIQRTAIASPASGLLVFDNDTQSFWFFSAGAWIELTDQSSLQWTPNGSNISYTAGNVGIGDATPAATLTVGNGDKFQVSGAQGDVTLTDDEASIQFPSTSGSNSPMLYMFSSGIQNADRMVLGHSPAYPAWGIEYDDTTDIMFFRNTASRVAGFKLSGGVGIGTSAENQHSSAILDVASTNKGFLPPRMSSTQRNNITTPAAGLVIFNTTENALNVFNGSTWTSLTPVQDFQCGLSFTVNHQVSNGVAPVNKTITYGTTNGIHGEPSKCWITQNLGADWQTSAVNDASEPSAGWYWQFNKKQGYKHDGTTHTPNTTWISSTNENADWAAANDPCTLELGAGWRLPTYTEWLNVDATGSWTTWTGPWNSVLKLHAAGWLSSTTGTLYDRGTTGHYWSSSQNGNSNGWALIIASSNSIVFPYSKSNGYTSRCLRDN